MRGPTGATGKSRGGGIQIRNPRFEGAGGQGDDGATVFSRVHVLSMENERKYQIRFSRGGTGRVAHPRGTALSPLRLQPHPPLLLLRSSLYAIINAIRGTANVMEISMCRRGLVAEQPRAGDLSDETKNIIFL